MEREVREIRKQWMKSCIAGEQSLTRLVFVSLFLFLKDHLEFSPRRIENLVEDTKRSLLSYSERLLDE